MLYAYRHGLKSKMALQVHVVLLERAVMQAAQSAIQNLVEMCMLKNIDIPRLTVVRLVLLLRISM